MSKKEARVERPKVSVITATYNCADQLAKLAESLQRQTFRDYEWIVIDGGSTDGTNEIIVSLGPQIACTLSEGDDGIYDAWNKGVERARGERILFLGADDEIAEGWLDTVSRVPESADLIYGDLEIVDRETRETRGVVRGIPWARMRELLARGMHVLPPHAGLVHSKRLFEGLRFNTRFRLQADYDFVMRAEIHDAVYLPNVIQARFALGGTSSTASNVARGYNESREILAQFAIAMPVAARLHWSAKRLLSRFPRIYDWLQKIRWRMTLR